MAYSAAALSRRSWRNALILAMCLTRSWPCDSLSSALAYRCHHAHLPVALHCNHAQGFSGVARNMGSSRVRSSPQLVLYTSLVEPDYLITDCVQVENRPALIDVLSRPSVLVRILLLVVGMGISLNNIIGNYSESYLSLEAAGVALGVVAALTDYHLSRPPYYGLPCDTVSPNIRCGVIDDAVVHLYSAIYTSSAIWLAFRSGPFCPAWLPSLDGILGWAAAASFFFSLLAPILTLLHHYKYMNAESLLRTIVSVARDEKAPQLLPELTETEVFRAQNMLAVGIVGCIFAPMTFKLALSGEDWWSRVADMYTAQRTLESSTALFGVFATQASMVAHTAAKAGVAPLRIVAPSFAALCFALTIFPCACALYWLGQDISFFSLYSMQ